VLLDGGEPIDPVVLGVGQGVLGKQAGYGVVLQLAEGRYAQVPIEQDAL
jgi:hypothetical protein